MVTCNFEIPYWGNGYTVIGVDEVGRGCLAGPVTAGAVAFKPLTPALQGELLSLGINDSKKVTPMKRNHLVPLIKTYASAYATRSVCAHCINEKGITAALYEAMTQAIQHCIDNLTTDKIVLLIDGNILPNLPLKRSVETSTIIKGDALSISIASASILAKVERDTYMTTLSKNFPHYKWDQNKGYGTLDHRTSIKTYGLTEYHRSLFVRNVCKM